MSLQHRLWEFILIKDTKPEGPLHKAAKGRDALIFSLFHSSGSKVALIKSPDSHAMHGPICGREHARPRGPPAARSRLLYALVLWQSVAILCT